MVEREQVEDGQVFRGAAVGPNLTVSSLVVSKEEGGNANRALPHRRHLPHRGHGDASRQLPAATSFISDARSSRGAVNTAGFDLCHSVT